MMQLCSRAQCLIPNPHPPVQLPASLRNNFQQVLQHWLVTISEPPQDPPNFFFIIFAIFLGCIAYCLRRNGGTLCLVICEVSITLRQRYISPQFHHKFSQATGAAEAATIPCQTRQCSESTVAPSSMPPPSHLAGDVAGGTRGRSLLFE